MTFRSISTSIESCVVINLMKFLRRVVEVFTEFNAEY